MTNQTPTLNYTIAERQSFRNRVREEQPTLDDCRAGVARVSGRGKVKWIKASRLPPRLQRAYLITQVCEGIIKSVGMSYQMGPYTLPELYYWRT